jgi:tRNA (adenine57-N1/adenine58-N1)-methyltransferase catalytic subunit
MQPTLAGISLASPRRIQDGDLAIVYVSHDDTRAVVVSKGRKFEIRYGAFKHDDWIGRPYGSKMYTSSGAWILVLAPTPELWTQSLKHRTQILYKADISLICAGLELRPGRVVRFLTRCPDQPSKAPGTDASDSAVQFKIGICVLHEFNLI